MKKSNREEIYELFKSAACTKQDVFQVTKEVFAEFKVVLQEIVEEYKEGFGKADDRVRIEYQSNSDFQARLTFGGDVLLFHMHTNVFSFEPEHHIWKTGYVKEDKSRAYCGMINIYNFLADSMKYNRVNDSGYLVSRFFVNKDRHYFAEGKKELNYLFSDFIHNTVSKEAITELIETSIRYAVKFELQTPPFHKMETITVNQIKELSKSSHMRTSKRLGFKLNEDS